MHFDLGQGFVDFRDRQKLLHFHDFACNVWCDGMEDCCHSLSQAKGFEDSGGSPWKTYRRSYQCDSEVGHDGVVSP